MWNTREHKSNRTHALAAGKSYDRGYKPFSGKWLGDSNKWLCTSVRNDYKNVLSMQTRHFMAVHIRKPQYIENEECNQV